MVKNKEILARPSIGSIHVYEPSLGNENGYIFGRYLVKITKYVEEMPVCIILEVLEHPISTITRYEIGEEKFFIVLTSEPDDILKEII